MATKTAVTLLQEMMIKSGVTPEYECISQSGPAHEAVFEVVCVCHQLKASASARSKRDAKQEAARRMLAMMSNKFSRELPAGPAATAAAAAAPPPPVASRTHVALLKEYCDQYRLGGVEYEVVGDTGPPHARQFTVSARLGDTTRLAAASTKKAARQLAAEQLYTYLRNNLTRSTADFVESEALSRAHERVMERYAAQREEAARRPCLGQRVADYHTGLAAAADPDQHAEALEALKLEDDNEAIAGVAKALNLEVSEGVLESESGALHTLSLAPAWPPLCVAGRRRAAAAAAARRLLTRALRHPPAAPPPTTA